MTKTVGKFSRWTTERNTDNLIDDRNTNSATAVLEVMRCRIGNHVGWRHYSVSADWPGSWPKQEINSNE